MNLVAVFGVSIFALFAWRDLGVAIQDGGEEGSSNVSGNVQRSNTRKDVGAGKVLQFR